MEKPSIHVNSVGKTRQPVIVVDNFFGRPETLNSFAKSAPSFSRHGSDYYPGLRKPLSEDYSNFVLQTIAPIIRDVYQLNSNGQFDMLLCALSLTVTPVEQLRPIQKLPHIDTHDDNHFAVVHYLCDETFGGTSFYRHISSGLESIDDAHFQHYFRELKQEVINNADKINGYMDGSNVLFERIGNVDVKYNRAVIYRSNLLHSGDIKATGLSPLPDTGRLTANSFIRFSQ